MHASAVFTCPASAALGSRPCPVPQSVKKKNMVFGCLRRHKVQLMEEEYLWAATSGAEAVIRAATKYIVNLINPGLGDREGRVGLVPQSTKKKCPRAQLKKAGCSTKDVLMLGPES